MRKRAAKVQLPLPFSADHATTKSKTHCKNTSTAERFANIKARAAGCPCPAGRPVHFIARLIDQILFTLCQNQTLYPVARWPFLQPPHAKQRKAPESARAQSGFIPVRHRRTWASAAHPLAAVPAIPFTALRTPDNYQEQNALPKNDRPSSKSPVPLAERFAYKNKYKSKNVLVDLGVDFPAIYRLITES